jgi:predicted permease
MGTLWQDLRHGCRTLLKSPGFAAIAIVTLGLGMAVNTTIFCVLNGLLLRPLPVPHPEQITVLTLEQSGSKDFQDFSYPDYKDFQNQTDAFSDVIGYRVTLAGLAADGKGNHCIITRVTGNYFSVLGVKPALGRLIVPKEGQSPGADPVIVLGYSFWQRRFRGDKTVVGRQVEINNRPFTVVGITPREFHGTYSVLDSDAYVPLSAVVDDEKGEEGNKGLWTERGKRTLKLMGRLRPGADLAQAQAAISVVAQRLAEQHPDTDRAISVRVFPERLARPEPDPDNTLVTVFAAFMALAALVLLVACFNIANVLLVRATVRQREMAIRAALGAGRARLVRQYLTESLLLAVLGGGTGLLLGSWASAFLSSLPLGSDLPFQFDFQPDERVYLFAFLAVLLTGVLVGIVPALRVARTDVGSVLHEGGRGSSDGPRRHLARNTLVVAQVAGSLLLLIVAGLFVRSLDKAQRMHLGFNPDHILNFSVDVEEIGLSEARGREFYRDLESRLRAEPGVVSVAQAFSVPMGYISASDPLTIEGHPTEPAQQPPASSYNMVSRDYFKTLEIPILRGRGFRDTDGEKAPLVTVVNQTMAKKFWPQQDPIGKRFSMQSPGGPFVEIVGVAQDSKYQSVTEAPETYFYVPIEQSYVELRTFHVRTSVEPQSLEALIASEIHEAAPNLAVTEMKTMNQALLGANGFLFFHLGAQVSGAMGLLGLILAVVGVYSVVSYAAAQRTHEIGIRMALGADRGDILRIVFTKGLVIVAIGVALGLLVAWLGTRALAKMLVGVSPHDLFTYGLVTTLLAGVALLACWVPAHRAMRVDPMVALRHE